MNELAIKITGHQIVTNLDDLKKELQEKADMYSAIVVTEGDVKEAKGDLADLRKMKDSIDSERKRVKKEWMAPYLVFEEKVKETLSVLDPPIAQIDTHLKEFDQRRREEKKKHVRELYDKSIGDKAEFLPFETIFKDKWLNVTTKDSEIASDISEMVTLITADLDSIKALNSEIEDECIKAFKAAGNNIAAAIKRDSDYREAKAAAERKIKEEAERKALEEKERQLREQIAVEERHEPPEGFMNPSVEEDLEIPFMGTPEEFAEPALTIQIIGAENIEKVREFLAFSEIEYKEI